MPAVNGGSASSPGVLPFRKAINRSGSGEMLRSLPGSSLFVCDCWIPDAAASSSVERQALPDGATSSSVERQALPDGAPLRCPGRQSSVPTVSCQQLLRHGAAAAADSRWLSATAPRPATAQPQRPGQQLIPDGFPPQRPGQQQTSSGGEKYSGLASNLAHLGRIC